MILTSTVKIKSKKFVLVPVKADKDICIEKIPEAMAKINELELVAPVYLGQVIMENFIEDGICLVATKTILE